jgi:hypothetical protein
MTWRLVFLFALASTTLSGSVTSADIVIDSIAFRFVNTAATYDSMPGSASNTTPGLFAADESGFGSGPGGIVSTNAKQNRRRLPSPGCRSAASATSRRM